MTNPKMKKLFVHFGLVWQFKNYPVDLNPSECLFDVTLIFNRLIHEEQKSKNKRKKRKK